MSIAVKKVILAPMEGVIDALMRDTLTQLNHYDLCVTEFIRVVKGIVPNKIFFRICPELQQQATINNTPIRLQLLGQHPQWLAENAVKAISLGSHGVDMNFGCPAKTVNKSKGGAVLLNNPELIYQIMRSIKEAIGTEHIASAKVRLGYENTNLFTEIVDAVAQAGTNMLTIHARTKKDGYKPPAYWQHIAKISKNSAMDIIANGEIWSKQDAINCIKQSGTQHLMLGRGALAIPNLANVIKTNEESMNVKQLIILLQQYCLQADNHESPYYLSSRLKQWFRYITMQFPQLKPLLSELKPLTKKDDIENLLKKYETRELLEH